VNTDRNRASARIATELLSESPFTPSVDWQKQLEVVGELSSQVTPIASCSRDKQLSAKRGRHASILSAMSLACLSAVAHAGVLLQENFDGTLGQFTSVGTVTVTTSGAQMAGSFGGTDGAITSPAINTVGVTALSLSFTRATTGLDSGESGNLEYSTNGTTYTSLASTQSASGPITVALPAAAENQAALRLRWRINASLSSEYFTVDTIVLQGTGGGGGCEPNCPPPPTNPFAKGPDPTTAALEATTGPFQTSTLTLSASATPGFGAGTVYYPNTAGSYAAVAVVPGYLATQSSVNWWGPRLASHGFVVVVFDTNSTSDQPPSRATQLMSALNYIVTLSGQSGHVLFGKVDGNRLGVMGWSMGGGGAFLAARDNPSLKAAIPFAPWVTTTNYSAIQVPTLVIACENDSVASVSSHASPSYESIPTTVSKAYAEVNGGSHSCAGSGASSAVKAKLGKYGVAWMKRFMDNDTRYSPFLCGAPHQADLGSGSVFSEYRPTSCSY
jgi:dienelactone hydrolase